MRAELRDIQPNEHLDWGAFVVADRPAPGDDFGWFALDIGYVGGSFADMFQVLVATPAAASRARGRGERRFEGFLVDSFEPEAIAIVLRQYVSSVSGRDWAEIVEQLRRRMRWEYEGMEPI